MRPAGTIAFASYPSPHRRGSTVPDMKEEFERVRPMLAVPDASLAADYYRDILGFEIDLLWGDQLFYGIASRGGAGIHFIHSSSIQSEKGEKGGAYITVSDVDVIHSELEGIGAKLWGIPEDREYGMRDFIVEDPLGYRLCFGQPIPEPGVAEG